MVRYRREYERQLSRSDVDVSRYRPRHRVDLHREHCCHYTHHLLHRHHPRLDHFRRRFLRLDARIPRRDLPLHPHRFIRRFCHPHGPRLLRRRRTRRPHPSRPHARSFRSHGFPHRLRRVHHLRLRLRPLLLHHHILPKIRYHRHDFHGLRVVRLVGVLRRLIVGVRPGRELREHPRLQEYVFVQTDKVVWAKLLLATRKPRRTRTRTTREIMIVFIRTYPLLNDMRPHPLRPSPRSKNYLL